jgi:hypothetical protein
MADTFRLSVIVPTVSRPTLVRALRALTNQAWETGDEVILIGDGPQPVASNLLNQFVERGLPGRYVEMPRTANGGDWGHTPRNRAIDQRLAVGDYLVAADDDDAMAPDAIRRIRETLKLNPNRPHIFRQVGPPEHTVWRYPKIERGNVSTATFVPPNVPGMLGRYTQHFYSGDHDFVKSTCDMYPNGPVWCPEIIMHIRPA